jgi:hypothetical protein
MTYWTYDPSESAFAEQSSASRKIFTRAAPVLAAFSFSAVVALRLAGGLAEQAYAPSSAAPKLAAAPVPADAKTQARARLAQGMAQAQQKAQLEAKTQAAPGQNPFGSLFDPEGTLVGVPALFAQNEPIGPAFSPLQGQPLFALVDPTPQLAEQSQSAEMQQAENEPAEGPEAEAAPEAVAPTTSSRARMQVAEAEETVPVPPVRPAELAVQPPRAIEPSAPRRQVARATPRGREPATPVAQNDPRGFFDKLFGQDNANKKGPQLAYASPDAGGLNLFGGGQSASPSPVTASNGTAVYDIANHTVYLPSGKRLEAHSGLGPYIDDPSHVHLRMKGSTPPAIYSLTPREALFHGVKALRLTPINSSVYGRAGLLAHTFMLGQRGDSNGCVSFRDYRAFLQAYESGEVRRLVVIPRKS